MDSISILERAYDLDGTEAEWLQGLGDQIRKTLDRGLGLWLMVVDRSAGPGRAQLAEFVEIGSTAPYIEVMQHALQHVDPTLQQRLFTSFYSLDSMSALLGDPSPLYSTPQREAGFRDALQLNIPHHAQQQQVLVVVPTPELTRPSARTRGSWRRIALHIGAAARLRARLGSLASRLSEPDAIFQPNGRCEHAHDALRHDNARRTALRSAVVAMEKARGRLRETDSDSALRLWQGLVDGTWTIVDTVDRDGRRYVVAHQNPDAARHTARLSDLEKHVATYTMDGLSHKEIAYAIGIQPSTVATLQHRVTAKMNLKGRADLMMLGRHLGAATVGDPHDRGE